MAKKVKKTNVADTSIKAYHEIKAEGLIKNERALVMSLMLNSGIPLTSRALMTMSGKERGNITRTLYDLERAKKITICKKDACPVTHRKVRYYSLVQDQQAHEQ